MVDTNAASKAALREAIEKLGRARLACDLANEIAAPAIKQLTTANEAIALAGTILQGVVANLVQSTAGESR